MSYPINQFLHLDWCQNAGWAADILLGTALLDMKIYILLQLCMLKLLQSKHWVPYLGHLMVIDSLLGDRSAQKSWQSATYSKVNTSQ